jgi:hypothetical protein
MGYVVPGTAALCCGTRRWSVPASGQQGPNLLGPDDVRLPVHTVTFEFLISTRQRPVTRGLD